MARFGDIALEKLGKKIVTASFVLSILYNCVGLSFAVSAHLSPMVAAILMPASSISIVVLVTLFDCPVFKLSWYKFFVMGDSSVEV